jgi:hypothetical protein
MNLYLMSNTKGFMGYSGGGTVRLTYLDIST